MSRILPSCLSRSQNCFRRKNTTSLTSHPSSDPSFLRQMGTSSKTALLKSGSEWISCCIDMYTHLFLVFGIACISCVSVIFTSQPTGKFLLIEHFVRDKMSGEAM